MVDIDIDTQQYQSAFKVTWISYWHLIYVLSMLGIKGADDVYVPGVHGCADPLRGLAQILIRKKRNE